MNGQAPEHGASSQPWPDGGEAGTGEEAAAPTGWGATSAPSQNEEVPPVVLTPIGGQAVNPLHTGVSCEVFSFRLTWARLTCSQDLRRLQHPGTFSVPSSVPEVQVQLAVPVEQPGPLATGVPARGADHSPPATAAPKNRTVLWELEAQFLATQLWSQTRRLSVKWNWPLQQPAASLRSGSPACPGF